MLGTDIGIIKRILTHAAAVRWLEIRVEGGYLAYVARMRLGPIGKGIERDRRPTTAELSRLFRCLGEDARLTMPMTRIVQFAIATAMRLDEICRADWSHLDQSAGCS
jgi:integrase